ncbi:hypothetical protein ABT154_05570 [Streptomyces sp. NPDC001728]|uniref:hypothetical protein n=1 Tax=Streptomyces sp. NPDC001728 TaxID=3154396 RepID=UPI0033193AC7
MPRRAHGTELVPTRVNRVASTGLGLAPGIGLAVYATDWQRAASVAAVLACAILAVRALLGSPGGPVSPG